MVIKMNNKTHNSLPAADGFHMPAEWAEHQAVWMIWPQRPDNWRHAGREAQQAFAAIAKAISAATPVFMAVPEPFMSQARAVMPSEVTLVAMNSDDCWMRDSGPTMVIDPAGQLRGVDWKFNAWGGFNGGLYHPWDQDSEVAGQVLAHHGFDRYLARWCWKVARFMSMVKARCSPPRNVCSIPIAIRICPKPRSRPCFPSI